MLSLGQKLTLLGAHHERKSPNDRECSFWYIPSGCVDLARTIVYYIPIESLEEAQMLEVIYRDKEEMFFIEPEDKNETSSA